MFLTWLIRFILGYTRFTADGASLEKFLNLSARAGVNLWNLRREGTAIKASVRSSRFGRLEPAAKKAGVSLSVTAKKGLPMVFERHPGRWGFIVGAAVFVAVLVYCSGFVWTVEITGNKDVETREIQYTLSDLGLSAGVRKSSFDTRSLEQRALMRLPELSWLHINLDGTVAKVLVGERAERLEVVPDDQPCNIKALETGQIIKMEVEVGEPVIKVNDTVKKGELVVSGVVQEPKTGVTRYLHARAKVIARTRHTLSVRVPFKSSELLDTGRVVKKYELDLLDFKLPLYRDVPQGSWRRMIYKSPLKIMGVTVPVSISTTVFYEYNETPVVLSPQEALEKAKEQLAQKEKTELSGVTIRTKSYSQSADAGGVTLVGSYGCEEDIAESQTVTLKGS